MLCEDAYDTLLNHQDIAHVCVGLPVISYYMTQRSYKPVGNLPDRESAIKREVKVDEIGDRFVRASMSINNIVSPPFTTRFHQSVDIDHIVSIVTAFASMSLDGVSELRDRFDKAVAHKTEVVIDLRYITQTDLDYTELFGNIGERRVKSAADEDRVEAHAKNRPQIAFDCYMLPPS